MRVFCRLLVAFIVMQAPVAFGSTCQGKFVNPLTDICWSCLFPLSLGSSAVVKSHLPDTQNAASPVCHCPLPIGERVGLSAGFWEPARLVDVTRTPFCMVGLGGLSLPGSMGARGTVIKNPDGTASSFYEVHWYKYPLLSWLNLITDLGCVETGGLDVAYLSEFDALWHKDTLNFILNPESVLFGGVPAQKACIADAVASSSGKLPLDKLFWCAGAQGSMYPLTGHVGAHSGGVQASVLLSERMAFRQHRMGLAFDSSAKTNHSLCAAKRNLLLPKSRYRLQMTYPRAVTKTCYPFGASTAIWGREKEFPVKGEDFGYLIWRKRNCCAG